MFIYCFHCSALKHSLINSTGSKSTSVKGWHGNPRADWLQGEPSSHNFRNPVYDATQPFTDTLTADPGPQTRKVGTQIRVQHSIAPLCISEMNLSPFTSLTLMIYTVNLYIVNNRTNKAYRLLNAV